MSGRRLVRERQRLFAVRGLGDDLELGPCLREARLELGAHHRLVVGDQCGRHGSVGHGRAASARCSAGSSGISIVARAPRGTASSRVNRPRAPNSAPAVRGRWRGRRRGRVAIPRPVPRPVSVTVTSRRSSSRRAAIVTWPPAASGSRPCVTAFSTTEISSTGGNGCVRSASGTSMREIEPRPHPHPQDVEVRLGELDLLPERRARAAHLRQRGAQVREQMSQQARGLRRIRLGEVLDRRQRVEQEMRLDLRLHQLEFRLHRVLRQQQVLGLGLVQRRARRASRASRIEYDQAREHAEHEAGAGREQETLAMLDHVIERVAAVDRVALDHCGQGHREDRAGRDRRDEPAHRRGTFPRRRDAHAVGDHEAEALGRDERVPEGARILDPQARGRWPHSAPRAAARFATRGWPGRPRGGRRANGRPSASWPPF